MILPCNCKKNADKQSATFQDQIYGKGMRVHTVGKRDQSGNSKHTCTVCGDTKIMKSA